MSRHCLMHFVLVLSSIWEWLSTLFIWIIQFKLSGFLKIMPQNNTKKLFISLFMVCFYCLSIFLANPRKRIYYAFHRGSLHRRTIYKLFIGLILLSNGSIQYGTVLGAWKSPYRGFRGGAPGCSQVYLTFKRGYFLNEVKGLLKIK